jgi:hypothetical protein
MYALSYSGIIMVDFYSYFMFCVRLFCIGMLQYVVSSIIPFLILSLICN